jgi:hypothetical protein
MFFKAARALACGVLFVLVCGDMDSSGELQEKTKAGKEGRREREGGDAHISIDMISTRHIFTIWPLFNIDSGACVLDIYLPLGQLISHFFPIILRIRTCVMGPRSTRHAHTQTHTKHIKTTPYITIKVIYNFCRGHSGSLLVLEVVLLRESKEREESMKSF